MGKENTVYDEILGKFKQSSSDKFAAIAAEQFNKLLEDINNNFSGQMCPDQYVGAIADFKDKKGGITEKFPERANIFADETDNIGNIPNAENILILILESPHTDEFYAEDVKDENGTVIHHKGDPIGPANGPTGRNIRKHIAEIFPNFSNYHLILMNAILFQCSLGVGTEHFRDAVFNAAWNNDAIGKKFFEDRLEKLCEELQDKNVVIVNACTQGDNKKSPLYCQVCKSIVRVLENYYDEKDGEKYPVEFYHIHHPSSWTYGKTTLSIDKAGVSESSYDFEKDKKYTKCYGKIIYKLNK